MKKTINVYILAEADSGFDAKAFEFLRGAIEAFDGVKVITVNAESYMPIYDNIEEPKPWSEQVKEAFAAQKPVEDDIPKDGPWAAPAEEPKPVEEPKPAVIDKATLKKALYAVKDRLGTDALLTLYEKAAGGAKTLKDVKEADYQGLYSAAQEALNAAD